MRSNILFLGAFTLCLAGCAGSNGGGHVVGNPIMSTEASKNMAKGKDAACGCSDHKGKDMKDHKGCGCGQKCGDSCKGCDHSGGSCGTSAEACGCEHK